ncbi:MAG: Gamma-glutamyl phosphate reductase [Planctomycetota bacterium]
MSSSQPTSTPHSVDFTASALQLAKNARVAAAELAVIPGERKNRWLAAVAAGLRSHSSQILAANRLDLENAAADGLSHALIDRLTLNPDRIESLAKAVEYVVSLPDPVGEVIDGQRRPNGLWVSRVRVPLGVVFFIYESRPNVTVDAAALCLKSGNAVILRGGREALNTNRALAAVIAAPLASSGLPAEAVQLVQSADRQLVGELLKLGQLIDVTIPRGGRSLIERVTSEATMPVIKHFDGICHVYVDQSADEEMTREIVLNSKCQRPGVCNAAETLLLHREAAARLWPALAESLRQHHVQLRCCPESLALAPFGVPATEQDYHTEHLDLILNVRVVDSLEQAVAHIRNYGSAHTDAIVTRCLEAARNFELLVDSAAVVVNASTRFNDGGELGLGAEIGISTDRFHARGPCGLREITSYKYIIRGEGQIRK